MTEERKHVLDSVGFVWEFSTRNNAPWERMYQRLVTYKKEYKDTNVPYSYKAYPQLARWVSKQRCEYRNKTMTEERKQLLDSIGFIVPDLLTKNIAPWEEMYERLVAYKKEHNSTRVPKKYEADPQLGGWVCNQRTLYRRKKMTEERQRLFESIGFMSGLSTKNKATWESMYQRLVAYKKEYKDTNVPTKYNEDIKFGSWVKSQRYAYQNKMMTEERKQLLNSIGFVVPDFLSKRNNATWEETYQRLVAYKKEHNDTRVPMRYKEDPQLGRWVRNQRANHRLKKMTEERKYLLNSIGFVWEFSTKNKPTWEEMYKRLVAYKKEHNSTRVPTAYNADPQLGRWVTRQRYTNKNKKMTEDRKQLLDSIGFV